MAVLLCYVMYPTRFAGVYSEKFNKYSLLSLFQVTTEKGHFLEYNTVSRENDSISVVLLAGLVTERIAQSLRIADRQAWPIRPKFGLDTEAKSSPPFLYSSLDLCVNSVKVNM